MQLWHATRNLETLLADGWVRPFRLPHVYAFTSREAAVHYKHEFGYKAVVELVYNGEPILDRWSPSYANGASVVRLQGPIRVNVQVGGIFD
jgi:hypothetical protein